MKKIPWGKLVLIAGTLAVLYILGTVVFMLYSSRQTGKYQVYLRLAFDAAEASDAGVFVKRDGDWARLSRDDAERFYYYMTGRTQVTLRRGAQDDPRVVSLRIGDDVAVITPLSADDGETAVITIHLNGKDWRVTAGADSLWSRLTALTAGN